MPRFEDKAQLDAFMDRARAHKPALYAFCSKLRAGVEPNMMDAAAMLREARVDPDEAKPILRMFAEAEREPEKDAYARFMDSLRAFKLPD